MFSPTTLVFSCERWKKPSNLEFGDVCSCFVTDSRLWKDLSKLVSRSVPSVNVKMSFGTAVKAGASALTKSLCKR